MRRATELTTCKGRSGPDTCNMPRPFFRLDRGRTCLSLCSPTHAALALSLAPMEEDAGPAGSTKPARPTPHVLQAPLAGLSGLCLSHVPLSPFQDRVHGARGLRPPHACTHPPTFGLLLLSELCHRQTHLAFDRGRVPFLLVAQAPCHKPQGLQSVHLPVEQRKRRAWLSRADTAPPTAPVGRAPSVSLTARPCAAWFALSALPTTESSNPEPLHG